MGIIWDTYKVAMLKFIIIVAFYHAKKKRKTFGMTHERIEKVEK